ncbi:metallo-beta-lactamase superfamily protein [Penicillium canescens]|nr:metallo-beta-lactamase superfamily protein [Penicillium canescens]
MVSLDLPQPTNTVEVSLVDSGARLGFPAQQFITPEIQGYDRLAVPSYSFLITHPSGQCVPCDLSIRSDYHNLAPTFAERCTSTASSGWKENGIPLDEVNAIIWSHFHFDQPIPQLHRSDRGTGVHQQLHSRMATASEFPSQI